MIATRADDELFLSLLDDLTNTTSNQLVDVPLSGNRWFVWTSASIYSLFTLAALIANSLFCYVIWRSKKLHTVGIRAYFDKNVDQFPRPAGNVLTL
jgi:hypothetical protein